MNKIAFKGFDKNLVCRGEHFIIGNTYTKNPEKSYPKICSSDGWHYGESLEDIFVYYPPESSRYCRIELLGNSTYSAKDKKGITTSFKILNEIETDQIRKHLIWESKPPMNILTALVKTYPQIIIGGSAALYLYQVALKRVKYYAIDIDIIVPYYTKLKKSDFNPELFIDKVKEVNHGYVSSGTDFTSHFEITSNRAVYLIDMRIDPYCKYNVVNFEGTEFKLNLLEDIIEAKIRYAKKGNTKHKDDLKFMLNAVY